LPNCAGWRRLRAALGQVETALPLAAELERLSSAADRAGDDLLANAERIARARALREEVDRAAKVLEEQERARGRDADKNAHMSVSDARVVSVQSDSKRGNEKTRRAFARRAEREALPADGRSIG